MSSWYFRWAQRVCLPLLLQWPRWHNLGRGHGAAQTLRKVCLLLSTAGLRYLVAARCCVQHSAQRPRFFRLYFAPFADLCDGPRRLRLVRLQNRRHPA